MAEISRKVVPYEYNYLCDQCNGGMMQATGQTIEGLYEHKCVICSHKSALNKSYPHVEYFGEDETPAAS